MFWIVVAILTAVVALVLIWPLARKPDRDEAERPNEIAVYQDQLRELERECESGLIGRAEADYARAEIGRRLIAAADKSNKLSVKSSPSRMNRWTANIVLLLVPAAGLCLYLMLGSPERQDMPLEARLENPGDNLDLILAKVERHLAQNPDDAKGWEVVAPVYFKVGRYDDAQNAYRNVIRLDGENVARLTGLGETLVNSNDGIVIGEARALFQRVLMVEPTNPRAQYYTGLAAQQSGHEAEAIRIFEALAKNSPADAPWQALVKQQLEKLNAAAPAATQPATPKGPTQDDVDAAASMSASDRQAMIMSMVEGLEARLEAEPKNIDGWAQLLRSYSVLGDKGKASAALENALKTFSPDSNEGKALIEMAKALGIMQAGGAQ